MYRNPLNRQLAGLTAISFVCLMKCSDGLAAEPLFDAQHQAAAILRPPPIQRITRLGAESVARLIDIRMPESAQGQARDFLLGVAISDPMPPQTTFHSSLIDEVLKLDWPRAAYSDAQAAAQRIILGQRAEARAPRHIAHGAAKSRPEK